MGSTHMSFIQQSSVRNRLLKIISLDDFALLQPHLELIPTRLRDVLIEPGIAIDHLYFPEKGFTSITFGANGGLIEVGMIGSEGLVGASPIMLGADSTPHRAFIQMRGENLRIPTSDFRSAIDQSASLRHLLLRYVQIFILQATQTAFANAAYDIEVRLARWLLMCHDRSGDDGINVTHEFLSMMLGVRRPGVTIATQVLEGNGLIKAKRGHIKIMDRGGMIALTEEIYGVPETEYVSLIEGL